MKSKIQRKSLRIFILLTFTFAIIAASLFDFYFRIQKRQYEMQLNALKDLSAQGNEIVESKLRGYLSTLSSIAKGIKYGEFQSDEQMQLLAETVSNTEFQRMGLADADGNSKITNGVEQNIKKRQYFQDCMKKKAVISENLESAVVNADVFMAAVPVLDWNQEVQGVLYGVVEIDTFNIYNNTSIAEESQYIHIIDRNGEYISRKNIERSMTDKQNILDGIADIESTVPIQEIRNKLNEGEAVLTECKNGEDERIIYFYPMETNDWYIVSVMEKSDITDKTRELLKNDVYILTFKLLIVALLVCTEILYYASKEKKQMRELNEKIKVDADTDQLTGLYNRRGGFDKISALLEEEIRQNKIHMFMILDLDNFKTLNDTLGHQTGDKALKDVAGILQKHFHQEDVVCRLGGDEFVVFLVNIPEEVIGRNIGSLLKKLQLQYSGGGKTVEIGASAGIATVPVHGTSFRDLYSKADVALYKAKKNGKSGYEIYEKPLV